MARKEGIESIVCKEDYLSKEGIKQTLEAMVIVNHDIPSITILPMFGDKFGFYILNETDMSRAYAVQQLFDLCNEVAGRLLSGEEIEEL